MYIVEESCLFAACLQSVLQGRNIAEGFVKKNFPESTVQCRKAIKTILKTYQRTGSVLQRRKYANATY
jgi:hypothetical protein